MVELVFVFAIAFPFLLFISLRTGTMESLKLVILSLRRGLVLPYWLSLYNCLP